MPLQPEFEGLFEVFNVADERATLQKFFDEIRVSNLPSFRVASQSHWRLHFFHS